METALKEIILVKMIAERGSDNQPIRFGICLDTKESEERNMILSHCMLWACGEFLLQTGRKCKGCEEELLLVDVQ
jgi:hypothetical protein